MGEVVSDLGNIYQIPGILVPNSSILFYILQYSPQEIVKYVADTNTAVDALKRTGTALEELLVQLKNVQMNIADSDLIRQEFIYFTMF